MTGEEARAEREIFQVSGDLLKATPHTEGDERYVCIEPSNENPDSQGERMLQAALLKAWPEYHRCGNLDINHLSLTGPSLPPPHTLTFDQAALQEIGRPDSLISEHPLRFKARIYKGEGPRFEVPNGFWEDFAIKRRPFQPSVAGNYLPGGRSAAGLVSAVDWTNTGLAAAPFRAVNRTVKAVVLTPLDFAKALAVGYGTDAADLHGADALRRESLVGKTAKVEPDDDDRTDLDPHIARYLAGLGKGGCEHAHAAGITSESIHDHFRRCEKLSATDAARAARRLGRLVTRHVHEPKSKQPAAAAA